MAKKSSAEFLQVQQATSNTKVISRTDKARNITFVEDMCKLITLIFALYH
jgi:hypothetical protein